MKNNGKILLAFGALAAWALIRKHKTAAVGKVERVKRRIYKEVSLAQEAGVDFSKKYADLATFEREALERVGKDVGWKQSKRAIESGKPYVESYYGSLRRAWNAVSGVMGIGRAYDVKDADGNVCLTWIDAEDHVQNEPDAHVLLALPPHVEQKATKAKKQSKEEETKERFNWAFDFIKAYINDPKSNWSIVHTLTTKVGYGNEDDRPMFADEVIWAWAHKKFKLRKDNSGSFVAELDGKEYDFRDFLSTTPPECFRLLEDAWKEHVNNASWEEHAEELDDIRRDLLDRAKLMQVELPYAVDEQDKDKVHNGIAKGEIYNGVANGDTRYEFLPYINYIVFVHDSYEKGGDTFYPIRSFDTKLEAEAFKKSKYGNRTHVKVIPVWDVPIEKITGIF